jgi:hypothetical protein
VAAQDGCGHRGDPRHKDEIELEVKEELSKRFPGFDYSRPRSEFFVIGRDLFYEFNREVPPEEFCDDFTAQLLFYAHLRRKSIYECPLGTYYVPSEDYPPEKIEEQLKRIPDLINWGKTIEDVHKS